MRPHKALGTHVTSVATRAKVKAWKLRNPEKVRAHAILNRSIRAGRIVRGPCEHCGTTNGVHGHHDDYSKPLEVRWLCRSSHTFEQDQATKTSDRLRGMAEKWNAREYAPSLHLLREWWSQCEAHVAAHPDSDIVQMLEAMKAAVVAHVGSRSLVTPAEAGEVVA